jgi:copper/silver efflux system protein
MLNATIKFFLENKLVTVLLLVFLMLWGIVHAPFNWETGVIPRDPVPVDAIPDIGENQQIIFTEWMGRSPRDMEDQITYPLTASLLGLPGVKSIRSSSMFGISSIYIIFDESVEYYWSRSRVLEKLNSLSPGLLPEGVQPQLGPDATALGQVFWYTIEGRDEKGKPAGGWDLHELRSVQDYFVKLGLSAAEGVSEVASIGGYVKEYQVELDPAALQAYNISLMNVTEAIRNSNAEVGANTVEINLAEYLVRGLGYVKNLEDIEQAVVTVNNNVPIRIKDIARVNIGPAPRGHGGILDKSGAEAVGGVVVARYGDNPLKVIQNVKEKIAELAPGLPSRTLEDGRVSKLTIVPFYDRTQLIYETLGTLYEAISLQILITIIVIIIMVYHLRASLLISALLPLAVLMCFIMMRYFRVDANVVALSGIAIAIGTMVDLGIILSENILRHINEAPNGQSRFTTIYNATTEVATAIVTAVSTTIVSFLPVFTLQAAEGKLFSPLAYTKTFALVAALFITLIILPAFAHWLFQRKEAGKKLKLVISGVLALAGIIITFTLSAWAGLVLLALSINNLANILYPEKMKKYYELLTIGIVVVAVSWLLAIEWMPLGADVSLLLSFMFILLILFIVLGGFKLFIRYYPRILGWCLENKKKFLLIPAFIILLGLNIWLGFANVFGFIPRAFDAVGWNVRTTAPWSAMAHTFPGMGKEFMPSLDEGSFLLMPSSMPHSGVAYNQQVLAQLDMMVQSIPEVELVVGKAGRAETALDPAPMAMFENIINYKSEYILDENGYRMRFKVDEEERFILDTEKLEKDIDGYLVDIEKDIGRYLNNRILYDSRKKIIVDENGEDLSGIFPDNQYQKISNNISQYLIIDNKGRYFRQWREHIKSPNDIWNEIVNATNIPGVTSAPKLQPIETRLVMLQTGMRAPMGIKVFGPDAEVIEAFAVELEQHLKMVPSVKSEAVFADRMVGKPYLEIDWNRNALARYGLNIGDVQHYIDVAVGGMPLTTTVEGRERYNIRARYARELRDDPESIERILIPTMAGAQIPLGELAEIIYRQGAGMIRGENTFFTAYVLFDKREGFTEVTVVEDAQRYLQERISAGELIVPSGVSFQFSGSYENQVRAEKRLAIVVPLSLAIIFLILYFQFRSVATSLMIFTSIALAFAGGFLMLWFYGQDWFLNFSFFGNNMRELFQMRTFNLSVAVWVGFIALFGIATDDGVVIATYLKQSFTRNKPTNRKEIRAAVLEAGLKRVRPCLMTTATTLLALLPILTSTGRGSDIMIPMAIPAFGGMAIALITLFIVPVLYSWWEERQTKEI